jgi:ABC-type glycerol-3-phosphate transport system permease component
MRKRVWPLLWYLVMAAIIAAFMIPLFWMISTSIKPRAEIFAWPSTFLPKEPMLENYVTIFQKYPLHRFMLNSLFLVIINIIGNLIAVPLAAYAFARLNFRGKNVLFMILFLTMIVPGEIKLVPLFRMFTRMGLIDTYVPLVLHSFFGEAFFIFLVTQYLRSIPRDLDDAARIDGVGHVGILYRILVPLAIPAMTIIVVYTFLWTWNEFMKPIIYLNSWEKFPIQVGLSLFKGRFDIVWNQYMAATLVSVIPVLLVYGFVQKYLIGGLASIGIKG